MINSSYHHVSLQGIERIERTELSSLQYPVSLATSDEGYSCFFSFFPLGFEGVPNFIGNDKHGHQTKIGKDLRIQKVFGRSCGATNIASSPTMRSA